jgi:hypothetical protein
MVIRTLSEAMESVSRLSVKPVVSVRFFTKYGNFRTVSLLVLQSPYNLKRNMMKYNIFFVMAQEYFVGKNGNFVLSIFLFRWSKFS